MKPESPDPMLASLFEHQRDADRAGAPSFARLSSVAPARQRGRRRPLFVTMLAAVAVPALVVSLLRLHVSQRESVPLPNSFAVAVAWPSATDALLPDNAAAPLVLVTLPGGAWTDELLPTAPTTTNE
jgi:hypothetical protein